MTIQPQFRYPWAMWLLDVKLWVDGADWRSWIAHALIGLPIGFFFGVAGVFVVYLVRELEQLGFELMYGQDIKWADHFGDIVAPVVLAGIVY